MFERWLLADRREPAERMLIMCALRGGNSTVLLLPVLLLDAPERARARLDIVSRRYWRCFFMEVDSEVLVWVLPVAGGCRIAFSLVSFPSEDKARGWSVGVMLVRRGKPIAVSELYRARVGGTVSVADALTPAEAECDRRRPSAEGTGTMGKGMVSSESGG